MPDAFFTDDRGAILAAAAALGAARFTERRSRPKNADATSVVAFMLKEMRAMAAAGLIDPALVPPTTAERRRAARKTPTP